MQLPVVSRDLFPTGSSEKLHEFCEAQAELCPLPRAGPSSGRTLPGGTCLTPSPLPTVSFFQRHHGGAGNFPQAPEEAEEEVEDEGEAVLPEHPHLPAAAHAEEGNHGVSRARGTELPARGQRGTAAVGTQTPAPQSLPVVPFFNLEVQQLAQSDVLLILQEVSGSSSGLDFSALT